MGLPTDELMARLRDQNQITIKGSRDAQKFAEAVLQDKNFGFLICAHAQKDYREYWFHVVGKFQCEFDKVPVTKTVADKHEIYEALVVAFKRDKTIDIDTDQKLSPTMFSAYLIAHDINFDCEKLGETIWTFLIV